MTASLYGGGKDQVATGGNDAAEENHWAKAEITGPATGGGRSSGGGL